MSVFTAPFGKRKGKKVCVRIHGGGGGCDTDCGARSERSGRGRVELEGRGTMEGAHVRWEGA